MKIWSLVRSWVCFKQVLLIRTKWALIGTYRNKTEVLERLEGLEVFKKNE